MSRKSLSYAPLVLAELLIKRALAGVLWLAWRARLNPFRFLRVGAASAGRYYLDQFLRRHAGECRGAFLEFGDPRYRHLFPPEAVERYDIINIVPGPQVSVVADIQDCPNIPDNSYDVIVCTQVLEHVPNPFRATGELWRILKPGGRLLLTVPAAFPYHGAHGDYWRFSRDSLRLLLAERFQDVQITPCGNRLTVVAAYWHWSQDHLPRRAIQESDPINPLLLTAYARKPA
ncbi:MAG: hypothetical protein OHK0022_39780 [Roseiflexaceae bacterium]